jgi:hypothetical protein
MRGEAVARVPSQPHANPSDHHPPAAAPPTSTVEQRPSLITRLRAYLHRYAVQLLIGVTALYILLRLLTITDRSPSIALAFVEASGLVSTILGLVLQLLPEALLLAAAGATGIVLQRTLVRLAMSHQEVLSNDDRRLWTGLYVAGTILWALLLTTVPSPIGEDGFSIVAQFIAIVAIVLAVVGGLYGARGKRLSLGAPSITWRGYWALSWLAVAGGLLLLSHVALDRRLWLPPERITVPASIKHTTSNTGARTVAPGESGGATIPGVTEQQDGGALGQPQDSIVGYVLKADAEWTAVLLEQPRLVVRLKTSEIVDRTVCRLTPRSLPPSALLQFRGRHQQDVTPPCRGVES